MTFRNQTANNPFPPISALYYFPLSELLFLFDQVPAKLTRPEEEVEQLQRRIAFRRQVYLPQQIMKRCMKSPSPFIKAMNFIRPFDLGLMRGVPGEYRAARAGPSNPSEWVHYRQEGASQQNRGCSPRINHGSCTRAAVYQRSSVQEK